jgi:photosystem I subunit 3
MTFKLKKVFYLATLYFFLQPSLTQALGENLIKCSQSTAFNKRLITSVKKLETRLAKYELNSTSYFAVKEQIRQTQERSEKYKNSSLLCGADDGLPHLIVGNDTTHHSEILLPSILFIYIFGWIGWAGRTYLQEFKNSKEAFEKEIIIDINIALNSMVNSSIWPWKALEEFYNDTLFN